jgi:hypothetical protein
LDRREEVRRRWYVTKRDFSSDKRGWDVLNRSTRLSVSGALFC